MLVTKRFGKSHYPLTSIIMDRSFLSRSVMSEISSVRFIYNCKNSTHLARDSVVMPAVRIARKLWKSVEEIMRGRMFSGRAQLIRDALREYVLVRRRNTTAEVRLLEAAVTLRQGRSEDREREEQLLEWVRKART